MKKKLIIFIIAAMAMCLSLGLCACAGGSSNNSSGDSGQENSPTFTAPEIYTDINMAYGTINQNVALPQVLVTDGVTPDLGFSGKMFFGETECNIDNGFVPDTAGEYIYKISATAANGATNQKQVVYYIEENSQMYQDKISSFDKPYGVNQTGLTYGKSSYSTDVKFGDEKGSLRLSLNPLLSPAAYEFILTNLNNPDITVYDSFYFYVYSDSKVNLSLYFNWTKYYALKPKAWTRIQLSKSEYETLLDGYDSIKENLTLTDINGLNINISYENTSMVLRDDAVYLSAIRGQNKLNYAKVQQEIEKVLEIGTITTLDADNIEYHYSQLSPQAQKFVTNYKNFRELIISIAMRDAEVTPVQDKVLYFDNAAGITQVSAEFGVSSLKISDEKLYDGEKTLQITSSGWDLGLSINQPFIYDISNYDTLYINVFNGSDDDLLLFNSDTNIKNIGKGMDYVLKANSWTRIAAPIGNNLDIIGSILWIRQSDWNHSEGIKAGTKFYVSAVYGGYLDDAAKGFDSVNYADDTFVKSIMASYQNLSQSRKTALKTKYDAFMAGYIAYLNQNGDLGENTVIGFDSEIGQLQITDMYARANIQYVTEVKHGSEKGSTKLTSTESADLDLCLSVPAITSFTGTETLSMYVYYEGAKEYYFYYNNGDWSTDNETKLISGEWTKITINLSGTTSVQDYMFMVMGKDWSPFEKGETVYFSALTVDK